MVGRPKAAAEPADVVPGGRVGGGGGGGGGFGVGKGGLVDDGGARACSSRSGSIGTDASWPIFPMRRTLRLRP